jgi:hypothetical protein
VIFSSTPFDYREPTHVNVRIPEGWAEASARHGFYRAVDYVARAISRTVVDDDQLPLKLTDVDAQHARYDRPNRVPLVVGGHDYREFHSETTGMIAKRPL